jgi:hypothetical protein
MWRKVRFDRLFQRKSDFKARRFVETKRSANLLTFEGHKCLFIRL